MHDGELYFTVGIDIPSRDLYRWCGSESVELVSEDWASTCDSIGARLVPFGDKIYLTSANNLTTGSELWSLAPMTAVFCDGFGDNDTAGWSSTTP